MPMRDEAGERIKRLRKRYLDEIVWLSIQRAKFYTESWRETEKTSLPLNVRVALAMKNVFERMTIAIDPDDRLVGAWTEFFLGTPIEIERGLFNDVLRVELDSWGMLTHQVVSNARFVSFMLRRYGPIGLYRTLKENRAIGAAMPGIGLKTMDKRKINRYAIRLEDKKYLQKELLPYWKDRSMASIVGREIGKAGFFSGDMRSFVAALPATTSHVNTLDASSAPLRPSAPLREILSKMEANQR